MAYLLPTNSESPSGTFSPPKGTFPPAATAAEQVALDAALAEAAEIERQRLEKVAAKKGPESSGPPLRDFLAVHARRPPEAEAPGLSPAARSWIVVGVFAVVVAFGVAVARRGR